MEHLQNFQGMQGEQGLQGQTFIADVYVCYQYKPYGHPLAPETRIECISTYKAGYAKALPIRLSPNFMFLNDHDFGRPHIIHSWIVL